jgi:hypothetical protein
LELQEWQPIDSKPTADCAAELLYSKRTWHDGKGNKTQSLKLVRDFAERVDTGFYEDGTWFEAGTGHEIFEPYKHEDDLPTHWRPLPEPPK